MKTRIVWVHPRGAELIFPLTLMPDRYIETAAPALRCGAVDRVYPPARAGIRTGIDTNPCTKFDFVRTGSPTISIAG